MRFGPVEDEFEMYLNWKSSFFEGASATHIKSINVQEEISNVGNMSLVMEMDSINPY